MAKLSVSQLGLLSAALLSGCARHPEPQGQSAPEPAATTVRYAQLRGTLRLGPADRSFTPCGSAQRFWVAPGSEIDTLYPQLTATRDQQVYVELSARLAPAPATGPGADHDVQLKPHQLYHMSAESAGCDRPALQQSRAQGNEPFWSLALDKTQATYAEPAGQQQWQLDKQSSENGNQRYWFHTPGGETAILNITPAACLDSMADAYYRWQAELQFDGAQHSQRQGCANMIRSDRASGWTGSYRSAALTQNDSKTELRLLPDYRAELDIHFPQSGTFRTEHGFWQPLQDNRLQLQLTRLDHRKQRTEIAFEVEGDTLMAHEQTVNGITFSFGDSPLQLQRLDDNGLTDHQRPLAPSRLEPQTRQDLQLHRTLQQYFRDHRSPLTSSRYTYVKYDLNQDGFDDALVLFNWCLQDACTLVLFQGAADGYRFVSRLTDIRTPLQLGREQHYGWQDLLVNVAPQGAAPIWRKLSFNGIAYPYQPQAGEKITLDETATDVELFSSQPDGDGTWLSLASRPAG